MQNNRWNILDYGIHVSSNSIVILELGYWIEPLFEYTTIMYVVMLREDGIVIWNSNLKPRDTHTKKACVWHVLLCSLSDWMLVAGHSNLKFNALAYQTFIGGTWLFFEYLIGPLWIFIRSLLEMWIFYLFSI